MSEESRVEISIEANIRKNPISVELFNILTFPSQSNLIISRAKIIVETKRRRIDIARSVQSQGKGKIVSGKRKNSVLNRVFWIREILTPFFSFDLDSSSI
jgi:hypothetical protein